VTGQQRVEPSEVGRGNMPELLAEQVRERLVETIDQGHAFGGDPRRNRPPSSGRRARETSPRTLQPVEQAGHFRITGDHAPGDLRASQALGPGAAKDAERFK
jgi:hypothetical protein